MLITPSQYKKYMTQSLGLRESDQDWGTVNADPLRVLEFIKYYETEEPAVPREVRDLFVYEMAELIVESAVESLAQGKEPSVTLTEGLRRFWKCVRPHHAGEMLRDSFGSLSPDQADTGWRRLRDLLEHDR